jgi:hypothetical protein
LEGPEIAKHHIVVRRQAGGDFLDETLHDIEDFLLGETRLVADPDNKIPFGDGGHCAAFRIVRTVQFENLG